MSDNQGPNMPLYYKEQIAKAEKEIKNSKRRLTILYLLCIVQILLVIVQTTILFMK